MIVDNPFKYVNTVNNIAWEDGLKEIPNNSVDLVVTDPPYGMSFVSNYRKVKHKEIANDTNLDWIDSWAKEVQRVTKDDAHLYVFCSWHNVDVFKQVLSSYFRVKNIIIWEKNNTGMGDLKGDYAPKYEMIIFCSSGKKKLQGRRDPNIIKFARTSNKKHPTEKPVGLIRYFIEKSSVEGDTVLDTFAGSFSTAKACIETNRNFLAYEIESSYCVEAQQDINNTQQTLF